MRFLDLVLYGTLIFFVLYITRVNNFWGVSKGTKKAREDVRVERTNTKKRIRAMRFLMLCEWFSNNVGFSLTEERKKDFKYKLDRLRWKIKALDRPIKPSELSGLFKILQLVGAFITSVGIVLTGNLFFAVFGVLLFVPTIFHIYAIAKISDEDAQLERDFPDLFIILYSRLVQGSHARLAPTLKDYLVSLEAAGAGAQSTKVIRNFVLDLRNNIEIYGDDSMAVMKLREKYTSVMIINFCNLAVQALNGVDNSDKLLAFKIELNNKRVEQMKERAEILVKRGRRSIIVVYVILFQFILLSWIAKLSQADGGSILGFF